MGGISLSCREIWGRSIASRYLGGESSLYISYLRERGDPGEKMAFLCRNVAIVYFLDIDMPPISLSGRAISPI